VLQKKSTRLPLEKSKTLREKSVQYPSCELAECMEFARIVDRLGGRDVSEKSVLSELGLSSRATKSYTGKLTSSRQFGLLDYRAHTLSITEKAKLILYPTEEQEEVQRKRLLIEAFCSSSLYKQLIQRFQGKRIPQLDTLANILMNEYKIAKTAKDVASRVFVDSANFVGVLTEGGILSVIPQPEVEVAGGTVVGQVLGQMQSLTITLSNGKSATITVPSDISTRDIERLKKMLDLLAVAGEGA